MMHWFNAVLLLVHRVRSCPTLKIELGQHFVFVGIYNLFMVKCRKLATSVLGEACIHTSIPADIQADGPTNLNFHPPEVVSR